MRRSPQLARAALLFAACLAAPLGAQSNGTAPDSGFDEVEVDLEGQMFNQTLPFDVPFLIHGALPSGVKRLEVRCWELSSFHGTRKQRKSGEPVQLTADQEREKENAKDGNCWEGGALKWNNTIDPAAPNPTFRVVAPRLEAESYYTFEFLVHKQVTPEQAAAFAQKVQEAVSRVLWGDPGSNPQIASSEQLPVEGALTEPEMRAIYDELLRAFETITGDDRIAEPGTLFSEGTEFSAATVTEFNVLLRPVRDDQGKIGDRIGDYRNRVGDAVPLLQQVRGNATLEKLEEALAAADPSVQHHARTVADALSVPDPPPLGLESRTSQQALTAFVTNSLPVVSGADDRLSALTDLLGNRLFKPDGSPADFLKPLVDSSALTAADLEELRSLRDTASAPSRAARLVDSAANLLHNLQRLLGERTAAVAAVADRYRTQVVGRTVVAGSSTGSFATQHKNYVSADTGLAYAPELEEFPTYAGTNIYTRPVNKAAPLDQFGPFFSRESLSRRVAFTIGLTAQGVGDGTTRKDLFNQQSLIVGIGTRLTGSVRLTLGGLVFLKLDPNPLIEDEEENITPFLSLSFDIDVVPTLQGIGGLFKTGKPQL